MPIFDTLNRMRAYQRANMPYLESLEDYDLVCTIGNAQEAGAVCTPISLLKGGLGATATVARRLKRLVRLGVVIKTPDRSDRRMVRLHLSREAVKAYGKLGAHIDRPDKS